MRFDIIVRILPLHDPPPQNRGFGRTRRPDRVRRGNGVNEGAGVGPGPPTRTPEGTRDEEGSRAGTDRMLGGRPRGAGSAS